MEAQARTLFLLLSATITLFSDSTALSHYQTFFLDPFPPTKRLGSQIESESESLIASKAAESSMTLSVPLQHLDALLPITDPEDLFKLQPQRDALRVDTLSSQVEAENQIQRTTTGFSSSVISGLAQGNGEHFTLQGVSTLQSYVFMVLDIGSDIIWLQCAP